MRNPDSCQSAESGPGVRGRRPPRPLDGLGSLAVQRWVVPRAAGRADRYFVRSNRFKQNLRDCETFGRKNVRRSEITRESELFVSWISYRCMTEERPTDLIAEVARLLPCTMRWLFAPVAEQSPLWELPPPQMRALFMLRQ